MVSGILEVYIFVKRAVSFRMGTVSGIWDNGSGKIDRLFPLS